MRRLVSGALLAAGLAWGGGAAAAGEYVIGGGDILQVNVWKNAELSQQVTVRPDGMITLPLLRDVAASGSTAMALGGQIAEKLAAFVNAPNVTVTVVAANSWRVYTTGALTNGMFPLAGPTDALQLLARAGGPGPEADLGRAFVLRGTSRIPADLEPRPDDEGRPEDRPALLPGDVLVVPVRDDTRRVLVAGEVRTPRSLPFKAGTTVLDAFVAAGGATEFADLGAVKVVRARPGGARQEIAVNLSRMLSRGDLSGNIPLVPGDIVVVPK